MDIDKNLVEKKLDILNNYIADIEEMNFSASELQDKKDIQHMLSFRIQQAVETAIDITTHIIAGLSIERKETSKDAFEALAKEKIITKKLAQNLGMACGLRNIIVHGYQKINFKKLFYDYKKDLEDLREFARQINSFLKK